MITAVRSTRSVGRSGLLAKSWAWIMQPQMPRMSARSAGRVIKRWQLMKTRTDRNGRYHVSAIWPEIVLSGEGTLFARGRTVSRTQQINLTGNTTVIYLVNSHRDYCQSTMIIATTPHNWPLAGGCVIPGTRTTIPAKTVKIAAYYSNMESHFFSLLTAIRVASPLIARVTGILLALSN